MRTREDHIKDIEWLFWESDAAMGISSTYSAFIQACKYSTRHQDEVDLQAFAELCVNETTAYDILAATRKNRRILKAYQRLSAKHKVTLEAYYEARQYDQAITSDFGQGIGLIPYTAIGKQLSKLALQNADGANPELRRQYKKSKETLKNQVEALYKAAVDSYIVAASKETR